MTEAPRDLDALVSARLCHDLISPLSAIGNGLELIRLGQGSHDEELDLIAESLETALAKLSFYRIAFGPCGGGRGLTMDDVTAHAQAMFRGRFRVEWQGVFEPMDDSAQKISFLALLCLERTMPLGGTARVLPDEGGIIIRAHAPRIAVESRLWDHITAGAAIGPLRSDEVQVALLRQALLRSRARLIADFSETSAALSLRWQQVLVDDPARQAPGV